MTDTEHFSNNYHGTSLSDGPYHGVPLLYIIMAVGHVNISHITGRDNHNDSKDMTITAKSQDVSILARDFPWT